MASGLAVSAFDYAAAREFIRSGQNGLVAPVGDEEAFIQNAVRLAGEGPLRQRLAAAGTATTLQLGWDRVVAGFENDLVEAATFPPSRAL
jgi:glycosyltransferase involved in cell wall biosynthesis